MNRVGQAKVAKLDAEARQVMAQIELAEGRLEELQELIEEAVDDQRRAERSASAPERELSEDGVEEPLGLPARSFDTADRRPAQAGGWDLEWTSGFDSLLSDRHFMFDEWDPVGGLVASFAKVTYRVYREQFGQWSLTTDLLPEDVLFLEDGRRVLRKETHRFGQSLIGPRDQLGKLEMDDWQCEVSRGDMVEIRDAHNHYTISVDYVPPRVPDLSRNGENMVVRFNDRGSSVETYYYHPDGREAGMSVTEYEHVGNLRRPRRQLHRERCIHSFRAFVPYASESLSPEPHRIFEWSYGADGRVASVRMTRLRSNKPLPIGELEVVMDREWRSDLDRLIATQLREEIVMSYTWDEKGRLKAVKSVRRQYAADPFTQLRVVAEADGTTDAGSRAAFLGLAAEVSERGPQNVPNDGDFIEVVEGSVWRTTTILEMRVEAWDARGRWTKASTYGLDEGGEVPFYESVRQFTDLPRRSRTIHAEYQLMPRSETPSAEQLVSFEATFRTLAGPQPSPPKATQTERDRLSLTAPAAISESAASAAKAPVRAVTPKGKERDPLEAARTERSGGSSASVLFALAFTVLGGGCAVLVVKRYSTTRT
jgi:YD repeat-containing protein